MTAPRIVIIVSTCSTVITSSSYTVRVSSTDNTDPATNTTFLETQVIFIHFIYFLCSQRDNKSSVTLRDIQ